MFCSLTAITSCGSKSPAATATSVEEAEAQLAKRRKADAKANKKLKKAAEKHYWSLQSKEARKSIKRNKKRHKKNKRQEKGIIP